MNENKPETFVHDGVEVKKTGRVATKKLAVKDRELTLVEITPIDRSFDWKKWVNPAELYVIKDKE